MYRMAIFIDRITLVLKSNFVTIIIVKVYIIDTPSPQLRLLYECCPMAYLIEQAGGKSTNGSIPTLDITPKTIHDRAPIFIGSTENVDDFLRVKEEVEKK